MIGTQDHPDCSTSPLNLSGTFSPTPQCMTKDELKALFEEFYGSPTVTITSFSKNKIVHKFQDSYDGSLETYTMVRNGTANTAPRANAGSSQTVTEGDSVTLDATASSDSDGTISSYEWKEGNTVLSTSSSFSKFDFTVGTHTIILTVTDNDGATANDMVVVRVVADSTNQTVDLNSGLVAHYEFEDNANDTSGNGNNGTEYGGVTYAEGMIGKAASFDGIDTEVQLNKIETLKLNDEKSVFAWIKFPDNLSHEGWAYMRSVVDSSPAGHWRSLVLVSPDKDDVWKAGFIYQNGQQYVYSSPLSPNTWHHIGFTWKPSGKILLYVDGVKSSESETIVSWDTVSGKTYIGRQYQNPTGHYFEGLIDDVKLYNRALSESEISKLYQLGQK